ncbi:MAG TPA: PAS domain S-box protein, partial [Methylomirabilota bacterium]
MRKPRARPRTEELQRLVHELRVQQLELERQNEEIRTTQRELEAERERVADLYQLAPVAHLALDRAGTIVEATVLAVALLGVDRRRLTRRRLHELVVPADWATLSRHLADVFAGAARRTCDLGIRTGRDIVRLVRVSSVAVADAEGQLTRCRTALMDITERKQAEEELKDSRAQFESIVTSALDAIVNVSGDGRVVLMNPAAEWMFGCKAATAIGHPFDRFVQESSRQWYRAAIVAGVDADVSSPALGRLGAMVARRADGTEFLVEASISEVAGTRGQLFTVILRDVSARQRAEHALAERLRLEQLMTHLAMAFGHLSTGEFDQEIQLGLRSVVDFLEVDRGGLIEFSPDGTVARCWTIEAWMDARDFPWMTARLQRGEFVTVSQLEELPDEAAMDRQSYLTYRVKPQVAVPLEAGGRVVGGLVFSTIGAERAMSDGLKQQLHLLGEMFANLLSRKQAEFELQKLRQDLAHVNRVATVGELTTTLAHELTQPLTAILSNAQTAQRALEADPVDLGEVREILTDIVEDDKRAAAVIHRVHGLL